MRAQEFLTEEEIKLLEEVLGEDWKSYLKGASLAGLMALSSSAVGSELLNKINSLGDTDMAQAACQISNQKGKNAKWDDAADKCVAKTPEKDSEVTTKSYSELDKSFNFVLNSKKHQGKIVPVTKPKGVNVTYVTFGVEGDDGKTITTFMKAYPIKSGQIKGKAANLILIPYADANKYGGDIHVGGPKEKAIEKYNKDKPKLIAWAKNNGYEVNAQGKFVKAKHVPDKDTKGKSEPSKSTTKKVEKVDKEFGNWAVQTWQDEMNGEWTAKMSIDTYHPISGGIGLQLVGFTVYKTNSGQYQIHIEDRKTRWVRDAETSINVDGSLVYSKVLKNKSGRKDQTYTIIAGADAKNILYKLKNASKIKYRADRGQDISELDTNGLSDAIEFLENLNF